MRIRDFLRRAASQWIASLVLLLGLVTVEFIWLRATGDVRGNVALLLPVCWLNAALGWLELGAPAVLLCLAVAALSKTAALRALTVLLLLLLFAQVLLTAYFAKASVPLGADLYGYSWAEIRQTIGASGGPSWIACITGAAALVAAGWWLLRVSRRRIQPNHWLTVGIALTGWVLLLSGWPGVSAGETEFTRNLLLDKPGFFLRESWSYWYPPVAETDVYAEGYIAADAGGDLRQRHYVTSPDYPFLTTDTVADVLSPFLRRDNQPPNLVIILVEGLGRAFTNEGAYLGNFTPFLDSLSKQSLYWDNFLSAGGRTFAALPSVLGSLPFAREGFLALGADMPPTLSLDKILQTDGYHTSFYYGGEAHFDGMAGFLRHDSVEEIKDGGTFPAGYTRIPAQNGFSWGYNDHELFRYWLDSRPAVTPTPQLSVVLTVSTHSPFLLNEPALWQQRFERRLTALGFDEKAKSEHRLYRDHYASILYTDDALRAFFTAYARRADYAHTVFLITGDHRMPEIPMRDKIDRFHVPLILYSPLLQRKAVFHSVSTHLDIAPSLLAWLHHAYALSVPAASAWVGDGLDTAFAFRNVHQYPLMQTKTDLVDFVAGENHLNNGNLFRLHADLSEDAIADDSIRMTLESRMEAYRERNNRWLQTRRLWPDTVLQRYRVRVR
jgi:hypothetical protein